MSTAANHEKTNDLAGEAKPDKGLFEDEFLTADSLIPLKKDAAQRCLKQTLAEIEELIRAKKWEDIVAVFHPARGFGDVHKNITLLFLKELHSLGFCNLLTTLYRDAHRWLRDAKLSRKGSGTVAQLPYRPVA